FPVLRCVGSFVHRPFFPRFPRAVGIVRIPDTLYRTGLSGCDGGRYSVQGWNPQYFGTCFSCLYHGHPLCVFVDFRGTAVYYSRHPYLRMAVSFSLCGSDRERHWWKGFKRAFVTGKAHFFQLFLIILLFGVMEMIVGFVAQIGTLLLTNRFIVIALVQLGLNLLYVPLFTFVITYFYIEWNGGKETFQEG